MKAEDRGSKAGSDARGARATAALVLAAVLAAAGVRAFIAARTSMIGADAPKFLAQARLFLEGRRHEAMAIDYHPLYPALAAIAARALGLDRTPEDLERAATIVSIALGALAAAPVVLLARRLAPGLGAAAAAAALYAVNPQIARHGADIMSEATYFACFAGAIAAATAGAERRSAAALLLSGALAGLAYLARPEGAGAAGLACIYALLRAGGAFLPPISTRKALAWRLFAPIFICAPFAALALPYMIEIGKGEIVFSQKKSLAAMAGLGDPEESGDAGGAASGESPAPASLAGHLAPVLLAFANAYHPAALVLFLAGIALRRRERAGALEAFLLLSVFFYFAVLARGHAQYGYVSTRHAMPLVVITLPIAGLGALELAARLAPRLGRPEAQVASFLVAIVVGIELPKTALAYRDRELGEMRAGLWIRGDAARRGIARPVVLTHRDKVAYYARGEWLKPSKMAADRLFAAIGGRRVDYVAIRAHTEQEPGAEKFWPGIEAALGGPPFALVHEERDGKGRFLVYAVGPP